jgi:hypothetical protein
MTNLTDLLPAGAGGKQVSFTASGAISSGQAVGLNSDGTVGTITGQLGAKSVFEASVYSNAAAAYDTANDKIVVAYGDSGSSNQGTAVVGTISGNTVSFGTPVVFNSGATTGNISIVFDANSGKFVISYRDSGNSDYGTAIVGTVSGTSISFGSETVFNSRYTDDTKLAYDSNAQKVVIAYGDWVSPSYPNGTAIVGTVSGTSISFGTAVAYRAASANIAYNTIAFDSLNNKVVICYRDGGNSDYGTAIVGTVSGTSISFGSAVVFESAYTDWSWPVFDTSAGKIVIAYKDVGNSNAGTAIVGTVSGTSISFGSPTVYQTDNTSFIAGVYNTATGQSFFSSGNITQSSRGEIYPLSVSGTSITVGTRIDYISSVSGRSSPVYDPDTQQVVITFKDGTASNAGTTRTIDPAALQNTNFIGIADAAISDTASGNITIKGGVASNTDISTPLVVTVNTASTFLTSTPTGYAQAYDPDNNKALIIGRSGNIPHSYVATVSGTSISYGSLVYPAGTINANFRNQSLTYDTNANKFVFCYQDNSNSSYGTAVVGTLSGTSTTWGTPVVYASVNSGFNEVVYDSNAQKVAVFYKNQSASNQGVAIVGTVSGTSISFGSSTDFLASNTNDFALAYDTNAQKIFVAVTDFDASLGRAYVATISGTSISFGTPTTFLSGVVAANSLAAAYDSTNQKCILAYTDDGPDEGYMVVGTISGTSVSFGSTTQYGVSSSQKPNMTCMAYDATNQLINVIYNESGVGVRTTYASVSGTSVTVESDTQVIASTSVEDNGNLYDPDNGNIIAVYTDYANTDGVSSVVTTSDTLVPNSTYYVQSDGTLSTTSSSVTAGKALSATSINLDYSS